MTRINYYDRPSCTGEMVYDYECYRFDNLLKNSINDPYYAPSLGIDWSLSSSQRFDISIEAFMAYIIREAARHNIIVASYSYTVKDFCLKLSVNISGADFSVGPINLGNLK